MNILILSHASQEPPYNTMLRFHNWGKELVKRGHKVTIVAASTVHNTSIDVIETIGKNHSQVDGVNYCYISTPKYSGNGLARVNNMLVYCFGLRNTVTKFDNIDVIISTGAYKYPFVRLFFKDIPVIVDTVDLWPQSIIEYANVSKYNPLIQILYYLEKKAYIGADALIFSMEGGIDYLKERRYSTRIDFEKVFHINMGCDVEQKDKELENISFDLGWDNSIKNLVYCGSIRQANQVQQICDAAKLLLDKGRNDIAFQIYGNGTDLEMLKEYIKKNGISNVHFYGRIDKSRIPYLLSHSTANILTYKQVPLMKYGGSQSKLFDYLASGRPIICNAKWGYNLIEKYSCGVITEKQTPEAFAKAIEYLIDLDDESINQMGCNGRKVAEMYDQPILVNKLCEAIDYVRK